MWTHVRLQVMQQPPDGEQKSMPHVQPVVIHGNQSVRALELFYEGTVVLIGKITSSKVKYVYFGESNVDLMIYCGIV